MKTKILTLTILSFFFLISCDTDQIDENSMESVSKKSSIKSKTTLDNNLSAIKNLPTNLIRDFSLNLDNVVEPSECESTPFSDVISESVSSNLDALGANWYSLYAEMNFYYTITDESKPYFGNGGQYTNYVVKRTRSLEKFWKMSGEVDVRGQHNNTLNDKDKIIQILTFWYGMPQELAQSYADFFVDYINPNSSFLIETPLLSFDGFAIALGGILGQGDLIVIGDGLVELMSETGVEDKIVWTGILAHEWAHQIQFNNNYMDFWFNQFDNEPERTRASELEADFMASYYMTHKRGATYNWKRVQDFLELFFNIGDCSFESSGHHGTPIQRMESSRLGYELAKSAHKKGKILSQEAVHDAFVDAFDDIVIIPNPQDL